MTEATRWRLGGIGILGVFALAACGDPASPTADTVRSTGPAFDEVAEVAITRMKGAGTIGDGEPAGDSIWLQQFDMDVGVENGVIQGAFDYVDYSVFKEDGEPAHLRAAPDTEGTAITDFVQISSTCVEFDGIGKLMNNGELLHFKARACDNGHPGVGLDVFAIWVPERFITHGTAYQRGIDMLSDGELTATKLNASTVTITRMEGEGAIGDGEAAGDSIWLQEFALDVGVENGVVGGTLDFTDYSVFKEDGRPARLRAGPAVEGTAVTSFTQISDTCVEFSGVGRVVNNGELVDFWVRACDNGDPGVDMDLFELRVPGHVYQRGPDLLSDGDLVRSIVLS